VTNSDEGTALPNPSDYQRVDTIHYECASSQNCLHLSKKNIQRMKFTGHSLGIIVFSA